MRYKKIADQIITDIRSEKLSHGQRMPSLRKLAASFDVSMTTALNSYRSLEEMGWIIARPQSGFFVATPISEGNTPVQPQFRSRISAFKSTYTINVADSLEHQSGPFGISQLAPTVLPTQALQRSLKRGIQSLGSHLHAYPDPQGLDELRVALSRHFTQSGFPIASEELVITSGCIDAVRMALEATTKPGDGVAISSPCFNGLLELLATMSRKVVEVPCTDDGLDLDQLERHFHNGDAVAGLFSSSHMNPQGISLSVTQKRRLAKIAAEYRVPIIEDDIYVELGYDKSLPMPVKYWDKDGYVVWCGSFSKTLSAGIRLGWCLPGRYTKDVIRQCRVSCLGQNTVVQSGIADFLNSGQYRKHLALVRSRLNANMCAYQNLLKTMLPENVAISQPRGGLVLWVQVPGLDANTLELEAASANLDLRLGSFFTTRPKLYQEYFRINIGWALTDSYDEERTIEEALLQLLEIVRNASR